MSNKPVTRYAWEGDYGMRELLTGQTRDPVITDEWILAADYEALKDKVAELFDTCEILPDGINGRSALDVVRSAVKEKE